MSTFRRATATRSVAFPSGRRFGPFRRACCARSCGALYVLHFVRDFGLTAVFLIGGAALSGFGIAFGSWHWWQSVQTASITPAGTVMIAALSLIVGVQCLLQAVLLDVQSQPTKPLGRLDTGQP